MQEVAPLGVASRFSPKGAHSSSAIGHFTYEIGGLSAQPEKSGAHECEVNGLKDPLSRYFRLPVYHGDLRLLLGAHLF